MENGVQSLRFRIYHLPSTSRAPIAQLDRAFDFESKGRRFESCWVHQSFLPSVSQPRFDSSLRRCVMLNRKAPANFCALVIMALYCLTFAAAQSLQPSVRSPTVREGALAYARASDTSPQSDQDQNKTPLEKAFEHLEWRSIGPANMGGRVADVEGVPGDPNIVYVATASGGLWKTTNSGVTWKPIFERQGTLSIGDIALQPGNPDVVWLGTGESNTRNSVSFGDGVYKSNDGGKTWTLYIDKEHGCSDLEIDPTNPNILYAGMWSFERKPWTFRSGSDRGGIF